MESNERAPILEQTNSEVTVTNLMNAPNPIASDTTTFYFESTTAGLTATVTLYSLEGKKLMKHQ